MLPKAPGAEEDRKELTIVLVRALRVAVDGFGLAMRGPARVGNPQVNVKLDVQVHVLLLCSRKF